MFLGLHWNNPGIVCGVRGVLGVSSTSSNLKSQNSNKKRRGTVTHNFDKLALKDCLGSTVQGEALHRTLSGVVVYCLQGGNFGARLRLLAPARVADRQRCRADFVQSRLARVLAVSMPRHRKNFRRL